MPSIRRLPKPEKDNRTKAQRRVIVFPDGAPFALSKFSNFQANLTTVRGVLGGHITELFLSAF
jgi:hypothetical protein